jgi:heme exporter protein C
MSGGQPITPARNRGFHWEHILGVLGFVALSFGHYWGLFRTPPDSHMGEVVKILFVHVPCAWNCMLVFTIAFVAALTSLLGNSRRADCILAGALEVGVLLTAITLVTGSIFAHPTWGVWWTSDPRLNSTAIMFLTFVGVVMLRSLVDNTERRATWSAVATILAYVNVPVTYMAVRWMRSIHQLQSSPADVDGPLKLVWRITALAVLALAIWFIARRARIEWSRYEANTPMPLPEVPHV